MSKPAAQPPDWKSYSVDALEEAVRYHNRKYWIDNDPEISDPEFDRLVEVLTEKDPDNPVLDAVGPAGTDAEAFDTETEKLEHDPPMLSLNKCYDEQTLLKWYDKFDGPALATPKIDGVAAMLRYDTHGELEVAATRGTGDVGEVMTQQARHVDDIPSSIDDGDIEVRGEAVIPVAVFQEQFKNEYANPRNLTAGALKQKDPEKTASYGVCFFAFDILGPRLETEEEKMQRLKSLGFSVPDFEVVERDDGQAYYDAVTERRAELRFETDGVVYKANRVDEQERMGHTAHHPRYALAYKFAGDSGESVLRDVLWSISRTGAINPVGIVDPVELSGATVTRVSLHNLAIMEQLGGDRGLTIGARVMMQRRGGVIPNLERVIAHGDEPVEPPSTCPECGAKTRRENDVLVADHLADCQSTRLQQLRHFVTELGIKGFGPKLLEQLYEQEIVTSPPDFFTLTVEDMLPLERVGRKLAEKQVHRISRAQKTSADRFLRALGIDELSHHVSKLLVREFPTLNAIREAEPEQLVELHTIGEVIADTVTSGLDEKSELIDDLLEHMELEFPEDGEDEPEIAGSPLAGKAVLFTGKMESMTRSQAKKEVEKRGGRTPSSVIRDLDFLVMGDADMERFEAGWRSSKLKKAERYNSDGSEINIIGESTFLSMLEESRSQQSLFES